MLVMAHERLDDKGDAELRGLLGAGDPKGEVRMAWHAREVVRQLSSIDHPDVALTFVPSTWK